MNDELHVTRMELMLKVNWLDKLERKFRRWAIPGLMKYIVILNGLVYLLTYLDRTGVYVHTLTLIPQLVWAGEYWRLITYILIPPSASPLFIIFILYFYLLIGNTLEQEWGSFKFNLFYLFGMIGTTLAAFITGGETTSVYLNLSLFLAFAQLFPNFELLLFFVIPVKIKYLGWLQWGFIALTVLTAAWPAKIAALASVVNFLIFFGRDLFSQAKLNKSSYQRRRQFHSEFRPDKAAFHKCTICGRTELDDPKLEFRYCAQCDGDHEYCMEHLHNHEHIKENPSKDK
jgi:membrane associated rhomboid family serine protease